MKELSLTEIEDNTIPYKELQCVLGAYFRPNILDHQSWQTIAEEIVNYCKPRCVQKIIRQIEALLGNPTITDSRLVMWVKRYAIGWTCQSDSEARINLKHLVTHLIYAAKQRMRTPLLAAITSTTSYA